VKRLAGMQPYFFPYIGYWQLIGAVDCFVLFDEAQYTKQGWINRNRILKPAGGWQYIIAPVCRHYAKASIRDVPTAPGDAWKKLVIRQLAHYRKKARHFDETVGVVEEILFGTGDQSIGAINCRMVRRLCAHLGMSTEVIVSSERKFDYTNVSDSEDWALRHCEQLGATELINPAGGAALFDPEKFSSRGIRLSFLECQDIVYDQPHAFEPRLSIIDVLMFNGVDGTRELLRQYGLAAADGGTFSGADGPAGREMHGGAAG